MNSIKVLKPSVGSTSYYQRPDVANSIKNPHPNAKFEQKLILSHYKHRIKQAKSIVNTNKPTMLSRKQRKKQQKAIAKKQKQIHKRNVTYISPTMSSSLKSQNNKEQQQPGKNIKYNNKNTNTIISPLKKRTRIMSEKEKKQQMESSKTFISSTSPVTNSHRLKKSNNDLDISPVKNHLLYPLSTKVANKRQQRLLKHNKKKQDKHLKRIGYPNNNTSNKNKTIINSSPIKPTWNDNVYDVPKPKHEVPINRHPNRRNLKPHAHHHNNRRQATITNNNNNTKNNMIKKKINNNESNRMDYNDMPGLKTIGNIQPAWKRKHKGYTLLRDLFGKLEINQDTRNDRSFQYLEDKKEYALIKLKQHHKNNFKKRKNKKNNNGSTNDESERPTLASLLKKKKPMFYAMKHVDKDGTTLQLHLPDTGYHKEHSIPQEDEDDIEEVEDDNEDDSSISVIARYQANSLKIPLIQKGKQKKQHGSPSIDINNTTSIVQNGDKLSSSELKQVRQQLEHEYEQIQNKFGNIKRKKNNKLGSYHKKHNKRRRGNNDTVVIKTKNNKRIEFHGPDDHHSLPSHHVSINTLSKIRILGAMHHHHVKHGDGGSKC